MPKIKEVMQDGRVLSLGAATILAAAAVVGRSRGGSAARAADVASAWASGRSARGGAFKTDGKTVWSYALVIGETKGGRKIAYDYTASGQSVSATTSKHSKAVQRVADRVVKPGAPAGTSGYSKAKKNEDVARAWSYGMGSTGKNMHTDGDTIWSYDLVIGVTEGGRKIAYDYTAPDNFQSMTTSQHVGLAKRYADSVVSPPSGSSARGEPADAVAARELALWTENEGELYRRMAQPIIRNLAKKMKKGVYDADKAITAFEHLATEGAKSYHREFGSPGQRWHDLFSKATRRMAAQQLRDGYMEQIQQQAGSAARRAGRWVQSSRWDAIGCRTDMTAMLDGYCKSNVAGRPPWRTRSEARADLRANYDSFVSQLADHYGVSESKVRKECSGFLSSTYDEYVKPAFDDMERRGW